MSNTKEVNALLREAIAASKATVASLHAMLDEQEAKIAKMEQQLDAGGAAELSDNLRSSTVVQCETETKSTMYAKTPLPQDIITAPIPDEEWKPKVAVDMTKGAPELTGSLEDDLLRHVYRQNRILENSQKRLTISVPELFMLP